MSIPGGANLLLLASAAEAAAAGDVATKSLRFNAGDSAHLSRTPSSSGNVDKWTWAGWIKRTAFGSHTDFFSAVQNGNNGTVIQFDSNDRLDFENFVGGSDKGRLITEQFFRDPSAWYHITCIYDSGNSTANDRIKLFVNGSQVTAINYRTNPSSGQNSIVNSTNAHYVGADKGFNNHYFNGYLADVYLIDGLAIEPVNNFIELDDNGVYQARAYSGTYGTNGFHLSFSDATSTTTIAEDSSGNDNNFTANNISVTAGANNDSMFDAPTNHEADSGENSGNYCVWNPNDMETGVITLSEGNLKTITNSSTGDNVRGTFGFSSGKWYWECTVTDFSGGFDIGFATPEWDLTAGDVGSVANSWSVSDSGTSKNQGSNTGGATSGFNSTGKVIGIAFDADAGSVKYFIDGTDQGVIFSGLDTSYTYMPAIYLRVATTGGIWNFGQRGSFTYDPPSGHKGLCTTNLPTPDVADGSDYFEAKTFTGTGSSQTISGLQFSPDFVWIKNRTDSSAAEHRLLDTIRGATNVLYSNLTNSESAESQSLTAFTSDGFTVGTGNYVNGSGDGIIAWAWDAGSSTASNTDGSLDSDVRVNQTAGFSIVKYTSGSGSQNDTVGHGLNAVPELILLKRIDGSDPFVVFHKALSTGEYLELNSTSAIQTSASVFETAHTSSVFGIGTDGRVNAGGNSYIAYVWTSVFGFSKFGSYQGNGSSDGPFVYTGFRPKWIMFKNEGSAPWNIFDTARDTFNVVENGLLANSSNAEFSGTDRCDILSNGFKLRGGGEVEPNQSGNTYLYMCFAENPFQANGGLAR